MTIRRVLMVCMGNICRSPTAEAVLRHKLEAAGLGSTISVDSAGTHAWHAGSPPDHRSAKHAARRGYNRDANQSQAQANKAAENAGPARFGESTPIAR